jgi:hypothetical protein
VPVTVDEVAFIENNPRIWIMVGMIGKAVAQRIKLKIREYQKT